MVTSRSSFYVQEVLVENCSYIFDTSAINGGRIPVLHDCTDAGDRAAQESNPRTIVWM